MGQEVVCQHAVDWTPTFHRNVRRIDGQCLGNNEVRGIDAGSVGQDIGERIDQTPGLFAGTAAQLKRKQIHAGMEKTSVVRQFRVEIITYAATGAQIIELNALDIRDELRVEDLIYAAAMLVQDVAFRLLGRRVPVLPVCGLGPRQRTCPILVRDEPPRRLLTTLLAGGGERGIWVDGAAVIRVKLEVQMVGAAVRIPGVADVADDRPSGHVGAGAQARDS